MAVVDSKNLEAVIDVVIVLCSGCNGHGTCNYTNIRAVANNSDNFRYAACICEPYWEGRYQKEYVFIDIIVLVMEQLSLVAENHKVTLPS